MQKPLSKYIDHSLLHPTMTDKDLEEGLQVAIKYQTATVCIKPYAIKRAAEVLKDTGVEVCTVIGFPHGSNSTSIKVAETLECIQLGATEIDMVVNVGKVLGGDWEYVSADIQEVLNACHANNAILKVIFENDYLETSHKIKLCEICSALKVDFIKTSTGYGFVKQADGTFLTKGATIDDLKLMRKHADPAVQIKAAGGIRNLKDMLAAIDAGATRIGATATAAIIEGQGLPTGQAGTRDEGQGAY
jgi:deoxyribose-phosphate aldolase